MVVFEFFLEKLSQSIYRHHFILKGGFLIASLTNIQLRTTMDLAITLKDLSLNETIMKDVIHTILTIHTRDALSMRLIKLETIQDDAHYPGLRATIDVQVEGVNETLKLDIATGDVTTPFPDRYDYQTLLDQSIIPLFAYTKETILAEKLETILSRGVFNTRLRDFYDVYLLLKLYQKELHPTMLKKAFLNTYRIRHPFTNPIPNVFVIFETIRFDESLKRHWERFQLNYTFAEGIHWAEIMDALQVLLQLIHS